MILAKPHWRRWYPVTLQSGETVWLEYVERCLYYDGNWAGGPEWIYRK